MPRERPSAIRRKEKTNSLIRKSLLAVGLAALTWYAVDKVINESNDVLVANKFDWTTPGGTVIHFDATRFPGEFYPQTIEKVLGPACTKPLMVHDVNVTITDAFGYVQDMESQTDGAQGVTMVTYEDGNIVEIKVLIAGGFYEVAREMGYIYTGAGSHIETTAKNGLNGTLVEEVSAHVCRRVNHNLMPASEDFESQMIHVDYLLHDPLTLFGPNGW